MSIESGRSVGEMLTVLAIMGVLSIVGIACYQVAINKSKANDIIHKGRMTYILMLGDVKPVASNWKEANDIYNFSYPLLKKYDKALKPYIKVQEIEKEVCQHLLNAATNKTLALYQSNETDLLTQCSDTNDIILAFDEVGKISQCVKTTDCDSASTVFDGFCNEQNECQQCAELTTPNEDRSACQCDLDIAVSCSNNDSQWCCKKDKLCSDTTGQCEDDFICQASYTQETLSNKCKYTFVINPTTKEVTYTEDTTFKCTGNRYCNLNYGANTCSGDMPSVADGQDVIIWGACNEATTTFESCSYTTATITENIPCPHQYYCNLIWSSESCASLENSHTQIFGRCSLSTEVKNACLE